MPRPGSNLNTAQKLEEQCQLLPAEEVDEARLVLDHFAPQHRQLVPTHRRQEQILSAPVGARAAPFDPALLEQLADESHDGCLVDGQLRCELDLCDPGILIDEYQQAEDSGPDHTRSDGAVEIAPQGHVSASYVVAEEIRQQTDVQWAYGRCAIRRGLAYTGGRELSITSASALVHWRRQVLCGGRRLCPIRAARAER